MRSIKFRANRENDPATLAQIVQLDEHAWGHELERVTLIVVFLQIAIENKAINFDQMPPQSHVEYEVLQRFQ